MGIPTKVPINLVNPTPAASTDLSDYVTLDTVQSITNKKSFSHVIINSDGSWQNGFKFINPKLTTEDPPSSSAFNTINYYGANNIRTGCVENYVSTTNDTFTKLVAIQHSSSASGSCELGVKVLADGTKQTFAPTPATADNSTQIATTAFVNNRISELENKTSYLSVQGSGVDNVGLRVLNQNTSNEGGQICLIPSSSSYYETIIDLYQNSFRVFQNGAANGRMFRINFVDNDTNVDCNGGKVEVAQEKSIGNNGYIRYYSGLQICWGLVNVPNDTTGHATVTFTKAFASEPRIFSNVSYGGQYSTSVFCTQTGSRSTTGFDMFVNKIKDGAYSVDWGNICWLAIGNWK